MLETKAEELCLDKNYEYAWDRYSGEELSKVFELSDYYKEFMSRCKTERECIDEFIALAEKHGYRSIESAIDSGSALKPGDKIYASNKGKSLVLLIIGKESMEKGMRIIGSHVDSPRLDLKPNPVYEDNNLAMLKTHYYGGIKKYQWVTIPLAIHGVFIKKDGSAVKVAIGEDENDPCFGVSDLLVHMAMEQMEKKGSKIIEGEDMNICVGSMPIDNKETKERVKGNILRLLSEKYGVCEEDFVSAELEIVPAGKARDYGLDRSMVMAYGHDDRLCAYTSFEAMMRMGEPSKTCVSIFVDKEEIGSVGSTSMVSKFFENTVAEVICLSNNYSEIKLRRALANSKMLSSDVCPAFDPNYPSVMDKKNCSFMGKGVAFNKYSGLMGKQRSSDANPEFIAELRAILDKNNVCWQAAEFGRIDLGGGGTIAHILAAYGMEVIDCGAPVLNIHSPWELACKADIYETMKTFEAFLKEA